MLKDFGHGISMKTAQSVFDEYGPRIDVLADWKDLKDPSSLEEVSCRQTSRCLGGGGHTLVVICIKLILKLPYHFWCH